MKPFDGIIDIHAHADPDKTARSLDVLELAKLYRDRGFRGVVLMNHFDSTAGLAYLVEKYTPGLEVYGGIVLNSLIGGLNQHAVKHFTQIEGHKGKIVYMPTVDSENEVETNGSSGPFVRVSKNGQLLDEVHEMMDLISDQGLVLSTGHSSEEEILLLTQAALKHGVDKVLVTNPLYWAIHMSVAGMVEAAQMGAYIEFIYYSVGRPDAVVTMKDYADAIKAIGPGQCILSSCGGQVWLPIHTYAWSELINGLLDNGITIEEIDTMTKINPARLLGLERNLV